MPPLHEALVEVHREYERESKAASDMAERYKYVSAAVEELKLQFFREQEENRKMKEIILQWETHGRLSVVEPELHQKLSDATKAQQAEATRAHNAKSRIKEREEQLQSAKTETCKCLKEKEHLIQYLEKQLA